MEWSKGIPARYHYLRVFCTFIFDNNRPLTQANDLFYFILAFFQQLFMKKKSIGIQVDA